MEPENSSETAHYLFGTKNRLPDELWTTAEVLSYRPTAETPSSGNVSDDSTASKEAISATSASWLEDEYRSQTLSPARTARFSDGDIKDHGFEATQALEYQLARLTLQYHALAETYSDSVVRLRQAEADINALMKHNLQLQASNIEFAKLAGMTTGHHNDVTYNGLSNRPLHSPPLPVEPASYSVIPPSLSAMYTDPLDVSCSSSKLLDASHSLHSHFLASLSNGLSVSSCPVESGDVKPRSSYVNITKKGITADVAENSPTSVLSFDNHPGNKFARSTSASNLDKVALNKPSSVHHAALPKSISIRSPGFLTVREGGKKSKPASAISPRGPHRLRLAATPRDIVPVASPIGRDVEAEYEVFNQGTFKTELCNKWQETGTCPYNDRCQFAHGIEELRPIIRHPRYKTELCRMVAAGDKCPYGHRCHFRHVLSEEEKAAFK